MFINLGILLMCLLQEFELVLDCNYPYSPAPLQTCLKPCLEKKLSKIVFLQYFPFLFLPQNRYCHQTTVGKSKTQSGKDLDFLTNSFSTSPSSTLLPVVSPSWLPDTVSFKLQGQQWAPSVATLTLWSIFSSVQDAWILKVNTEREHLSEGPNSLHIISLHSFYLMSTKTCFGKLQ